MQCNIRVARNSQHGNKPTPVCVYLSLYRQLQRTTRQSHPRRSARPLARHLRSPIHCNRSDELVNVGILTNASHARTSETAPKKFHARPGSQIKSGRYRSSRVQAHLSRLPPGSRTGRCQAHRALPPIDPPAGGEGGMIIQVKFQVPHGGRQERKGH